MKNHGMLTLMIAVGAIVIIGGPARAELARVSRHAARSRVQGSGDEKSDEAGRDESASGEKRNAAKTTESATPRKTGTKKGDASRRHLMRMKLDIPEPIVDWQPISYREPVASHLCVAQREDPEYIVVPRGTRNVALHKPVRSSWPDPIMGELSYVTDGQKAGTAGDHVYLGPGEQWVQIDLGETCRIYKILMWHTLRPYHVYHDVVVMVSEDKEFEKGRKILFNNDWDNSLGFGKGIERGLYIDSHQGKLIDGGGVKGRYVRLYSNGNYQNVINHYVEVEVYGKPEPPEDMMKLKLDLPKPYYNWPPTLTPGIYDEVPALARPPFGRDHPKYIKVPEGTRNVARGKPAEASSTPIVGKVSQVTDGIKGGYEQEEWVILRPGEQWVQIDLQRTHLIYKILVWHCFGDARVYHDVVVQVSNDPDFSEEFKTLFNNDCDNSLGLGVGMERGEYIESHQGKLIDAGGVKGRYVRLYSNGNTSNKLNHYVEVEVYGKPVGANRSH